MFLIPARDQFPLAASVFEGESGVVIVNSATGVRRQYYRKFAQYLARHGSTVVTYDYRGIGDSDGERTRFGLKTRMRDWALLDATAVLDWAAQSCRDQPITVIGHSFGGQCLGLLKNNHRISRAVFVGAQSGYWGHFAVRQRFHLCFLWYLAFPLLTPLLGYFPGRRLGLGEDLPAGVALEWARWCRQPNYLMGDLGSQLPDYFGSFEAPILAFKISDDSYAPARSVRAPGVVSPGPDYGPLRQPAGVRSRFDRSLRPVSREPQKHAVERNSRLDPRQEIRTHHRDTERTEQSA